MRSFRATALFLCVSLGWQAGQAHAQSNAFGSPQLQPLPAPDAAYSNSYRTGLIANSYDSPAGASQAAPSGGQFSSEYSQALSATCWSGDCGTTGCAPCGGSRWFGSLSGLVMGRNQPNAFWTTSETGNLTNQLMSTRDAGANWGGGGQVTVGYNFGCCGPALAFTYWGVGGLTGNARIRDPGDQLSTLIDLTGQNIGARPASDFFDNSREQRIERGDRAHNFEINLLQANLVSGRLQMIAMCGFRYFRFDEQLTYGATAAGVEFGEPGGADEAYLQFRTVNNLCGAQVGSIFNYNATQRLGFFMTPKIGLYGNQMSNRSHLYVADGTQGFDINARESGVSFLGEIDTGFSYALNHRCRAVFGYRAVAVTGIALSDNQFQPVLANSVGFGRIQENGDLILHGAYAGLAWNF